MDGDLRLLGQKNEKIIRSPEVADWTAVPFVVERVADVLTLLTATNR